ncbi:MAG: 3-keto-disaccharide hydrolase [Planctomycetota bacterium]
MKRRTTMQIVVSLAVCAMLVSSGCSSKTRLWNGKDFSGWKLHVDDKTVDVDSVWSVTDGVIHCKGVPNGYIRTLKDYSNYKLHLEWRWAEKPTNSGVLLHASGPDKVWPKCIESQLQAGNAGDFVLTRIQTKLLKF